jgi:tRNA(fMet)-specific endonuclease VapC
MAATSIVLDTSAYSAFRRGMATAIDQIQLAETILVPAIVIGELLFGFESGVRNAQNHRELAEFLASPRVDRVVIGPQTAERYALIHAYLRKIGRPIPTNDLWIAACTWEHTSKLVTTDKHFEDIPQIIVHKLA